MSSSALMSIGMRAMFADYAQMQTTGHNIANANVAGYSRQTVDLATSQGQYTGAGFYGKGVDVVTVQRASDKFLTMQAAAANSLASMDSARADQLSQLENVFPTGDTGMGAAMGDFLNAFVDLANNPSDASARQVVLQRAGEVASRFATAGNQISSLQNGVTEDLKNSVAQVNTLAAKVADVNTQIAAVRGTGQTPNDLMDQRDQLIKQISGYVDVTQVTADDGSIGLFIGGGQRLVLGGQSQQLAVSPDVNDPSRSALSIVDSGNARPLDASSLMGGSITGLIQFQNGDLVDARNQLGQMAASFAARVNTVQGFGIDMGSPAGAGAPIFSTGTPQAVSATTNVRAASGDFASKLSLQITDASQLQASDYALKTDPANAGGYIVTRQSDNMQFSMTPDATMNGGFRYTRLADGAALGDSMDGFRVGFSGAPPAVGDHFLLQPVGNAAHDMSLVLKNPSGIAAASPMTATAGVSNTGSATVKSLDVVSAANDPSLTGSITFTSGTNYSWSLADAGGNVVSSGSATWTPGQPIPINGAQLNLDGVPAAGDTFATTRTAHPESNNGNAVAFTALGDETFVGRERQLDGSLRDGATVTDAYASAIADVGVRVQGAKTSAQISGSTAATANDAVSSKTGVNIDEEAARLIQFQQGYQAAAKVLQVAQSVFDTMLQLAGR
jgi:flagellar hook-associated protein 1 FlgK